MADDQDAGAMQLTELEQELVEKRRRLEILDQQLLEEGSASGTHSPSSRSAGKSPASNNGEDDLDFSLHPSRGSSSGVDSDSVTAPKPTELSSRPHSTVGQTTEDSEAVSVSVERVAVDEDVSSYSPTMGTQDRPQVVDSGSESSGSDGYHISPAMGVAQSKKSGKSHRHRHGDRARDDDDGERSHRRDDGDGERPRRRDREKTSHLKSSASTSRPSRGDHLRQSHAGRDSASPQVKRDLKKSHSSSGHGHTHHEPSPSSVTSASAAVSSAERSTERSADRSVDRSKGRGSSHRTVTKQAIADKSSSVPTPDSSSSGSRHHSSHSKHRDHRDDHRDRRDDSSSSKRSHRDRETSRHDHRAKDRKDRESGHKRSSTVPSAAPPAKRSKPNAGVGHTSSRTVVLTEAKPSRMESSSGSDSSDSKQSEGQKKPASRKRSSSSSLSSSSSSSGKSGSSGDSDSDGSSGAVRRRRAVPQLKLTPPPVERDSVPMALRPITPTLYEESSSEEERVLEREFAERQPIVESEPSSPQYTMYYPALDGCRNVDEFEYLNRIEEGTYGVVFRGKEKKSGRIVALKKLKMEKEKEGFPITSLREVNTLLKSKHPNIVDLQEVAVGSNMDKIFLVMEYVEHDLKALMESMKEGFLIGEVKTLLRQLLSAVHHMHDNWILHRDLKTSNLLLSHKGILKVGDFGLAREYGSPPKPYTPIVVTLWYRSPELLLGSKMYTTAVDMWSVGCIFAELVLMKALFQGRTEIDQIQQIFKLLGKPNEKVWPGWKDLPAVQKVTFAEQPYNHLKEKLPTLTSNGIKFLNKMLTFDPKQRISAEESLEDGFFKEGPLPVDPSMFPTWPARSELPRNKKISRSPKAPDGGGGIAELLSKGEDGFHLTRASHGSSKKGMGFTLKF